MMNHKTNFISMCTCVVAAGLAAVLGGCTDDSSNQVAVAPPPPPPPAPPAPPPVTSIDDLMAELNIDQRVSLAEDKAPATDDERRAVLVFFDAIARGNAQALKGMLSLTDQLELDALVESGAWQPAVSKIRKIELQTGQHNEDKCALAVIEVGSGMNLSFQPQLWYYTIEEENPQFEAAATPPGIMDKLTGSDWIAAWHKILEDEAALAMEPDEPVSIVQRNIDDSETRSGAGGPTLLPGQQPIFGPAGGGGQGAE